MLYPGLGLGIVTCRARLVTDGMIGGRGQGGFGDEAICPHPGAPLLPLVNDLRHVSAVVGARVVEQAVKDGVGPGNPGGR